MRTSDGKTTIITIIYLAVVFYVLTTYVAMPIIITTTVLGRIETLDRSYDPPSGTPHQPQNVAVPTKDNIVLSGWLFPVDSLKAWVIILPDPHLNRSGMMPLVRWFTNRHYGVVAMDPRARGESGGRFMTGGLTEAEDLITTVKYLQPQLRDRVPVIAYGVSMGAVAALSAAAQSDAFAAVIADSPYLRISDWLNHEARRRGWLHLPGMYATARLWAPIITGKSEAGSNLELTGMVKSIRVPVLFLMGDHDPMFSTRDLAALKRTMQSTTVTESFPNGYANSLYTLNMDAYHSALSNFLNTVVQPPKIPEKQIIQ